MGLISALSDWRAARYAKKVAEMEEMGVCPECNGGGIHPMAFNPYIYTTNFDCPGCNGSGLFSDWADINQ